MTVVDSVAAVRLDEESGRLAGDHRVAHVRSVAVRAEHVVVKYNETLWLAVWRIAAGG
jgi:transposase